MKKTLLGKKCGSICLVFMFAVVALVGVSTQEVAAKFTTLRGVTFLPKHLAAVAGMKMMADRVNERSGGQLKIRYLGGPEVMPPPAQIEALRKGKVDLVVHSPERFGGLVPEVNILHLSRLTPKEERQSGAYEWVDKHLRRKLNAHYLGRATTNTGWYIYTNFPVSKVADLAGKQIAARPTCFPFFRALGAKPVAVGKGDWYSAVERGVVDAYSIPLDSVPSWGLVDITKNTIDHSFYKMSSGAFMINLDKWNKLSKEHQNLLNSIAMELEPEMSGLRGRRNAKAREKMESAGIKFIKFSPAEEKKFLGLAYDSGWKVYKNKVSPDFYAEGMRLFNK